MPVDRGSVQLGGHALTLEQIESVARRGASVDLGGEVQQIVADSARRLQHLARADRPVYGVNTGFGVLAGRRVAPEQSLTLSRNLILSHAVGVGPPFSPDVTRAAMVIRANALALGLSGVSPHVLSALIGLLNARITPAIPSQGSLGSSGDLAPLAHLALALIAPDLVPDTPEAWVDERRMPLRRALAKAGLSPIDLGPKDGLALTNGATFACALLALACLDVARLVAAAEAAAALSLEALKATSAALDERLHAARHHPGQMRVARRLRQLTAGSRLLDSGAQVQDAYSLRCIPQVIGPAWEMLDFARQVAEREVNAATDNPLLFGDEAISGGNFHGEPVGLASDYLKLPVAEVGALSERRTFRLLSAHTSAGLPPMLVDRPEQAGLQSGLMMLQYAAASLVLENQGLAAPASVRSLPTSADQEDHNANATSAGHDLARIIGNVEQIVAIELMAAGQALDLRRRDEPDLSPGSGVQDVHARVRQVVPHLEADSVMTGHLAALVELIRQDGWLPPG